MHHFSWYFIKGEKICIFIFQLAFCLPLISTPTLYVENWFYFDIICFKWQILTTDIKIFIWIFSIGIKILFVFSQLVSMPLFTFNWYQFLKCFYVSFQLVSKCSTLTYFNWYHIWFDPLLVSFCFYVSNKKGEKNVLFLL